MPAVQYPFIDIAVHERVKDHFARGEAIVLFSLDLADVYWANGRGAALFGKPVIYDLLEDGPNRNDVTFRQVEATGQQLSVVGDVKSFLIRITHGFQRIPVQAVVERIHLTQDVEALLFAAPVSNQPLAHATVARDMLQGFDEDDTHMAVLGGEGEIIASSAGFDKLALKPATARTLVAMAGADPHRLVKRPVPTAKGYLPAAIGKVSDTPPLHLLFAVETILGNMAPSTPFPDEADIVPRAAAPTTEPPIADPLSPVELPVSVAPELISEPAPAPEISISEPLVETPEEPSVPEPAEEAVSSDAAGADLTDASATAEEALLPTPGQPDLPEHDEIQVPEQPETEAYEPLVEDVDSYPLSFEDDRFAVAPGDAPATPLPDGPASEIVDAEWELEEPPSAEPMGDEGDDPESSATVELEAEADIKAEAEIEAEADIPTEPASPLADEAEIAATEAMESEEPTQAVAENMSEAELASAAPQDGFSFNRTARPTRFVWKIDAEGLFSEISSELAAAVGPHADGLAGKSFSQVASLLDLDPEGKIAELLGRRDTWSGKTIYWPIEGTSLRSPVDLAALPTYKRNREFDGFRGFGIVRLSDAVEDPLAIGLTLAEGYVSELVADQSGPQTLYSEATEAETETEAGARAAQPVEDPQENLVEPDASLPDEDIAEQYEPELPTSEAPLFSLEGELDELPEVEQVSEPEQPQRPEPPVLRTSEPASAREEDKIIRLEERRLRGREGLTPAEQEAFREIARQLEALKREKGEDTVEASAADPSAENAPVEHAEPAEAENPAIEAIVDHLAEDPADDMGPEADEPGLSHDDIVGAEPVDPEPRDDQAEPPGGPASTASESEQLEILAAAIPARTDMEGGLTGEALNEIPVALLIHAGERLIHANPEFLKLSGYRSLSDLEAVGGLDSLLHHKDLEDMPDQSGGLSLVRADDQLVPVTARLQSVRWDDTTALLLALIPSGPRPVAADLQAPSLTDAEEERLNGRINDLEVEVDELRSILETATDGVVIIGPEGDIRSMNRSASALFDYDDAETRGKPFVMLFAHESHRAVADYLAGMTGHGVASVLNDGREVIGREASGGFIPLFMTIGKLSASNGFCAVIRDITQWKRSEEDLKSAKRAAETANAHKSDFLARVSHEIRTPLNAIIGFSDMMAIEHFGPIGHPRYVEYANDIARSGRLVLDIVNDLLDISKIEAGEMELEFAAVGLNDAISEAVSLVQPQAHSQRVIIRTAYSDAVPDVVADLRSIKQIVLNILANAIRFTPAGGQIVVSTAYETNGSVVMRIRDTGVGMTRSELEQAMKPFRQVTAGARKRGDGTGLGLPLTKAMVDANRASFSIQSAPNEGTLVEITFPSPRVLAN